MKNSIQAFVFSMWMMLSLRIKVANAELTTRPQDTQSAVGNSASFECKTTVDDQEIQWFHYSLGSTEKNYVYAFNSFHAPYVDRARLDPTANSTGTSRIIVSEIVEQDAGIYECQDYAGHGNSSQASLTVLHSEPVCGSNMTLGEVIIGPNSCGFTPEVIQLSCSVNYSGTIPPQLVWVKTGETVAIKDGVTYGNISNTIISNLTLEGRSQLDGQSFTCQTTKPSASQKFTCSSGKLRVWHARNSFSVTEKVIGENVFCKKENLPSPCSYKWIRADIKGETVATNESTFKPDGPGLYRCEADCTVKGKPCSISVEMVYVSAHEWITEAFHAPVDSETSSQAAFIAAVTIISLLIVLLVTAVSCHIRYRKSHRQRKEQENPEGSLLENTVFLYREPVEAKARHSKEIEKLELQLNEARKSHTREIEDLKRQLSKARESNSKDDAENKFCILSTEIIETEASKVRGKLIKGLALLDNELYIFCDRETEVEIYDAKTLSWIRLWTLEEMTEPEDAAACARKKCIYISESKRNNRILKVDSSGKLLKQWPTGDSVGLLSVSEDCNVIVAIHESHKIKEFSSEGELQREFNLQEFDMLHPMHAIKIRNGNFIIIHWYLKDAIHRLCEFDFKSRQMVKLFGKKTRGGNTLLTNPAYLAIDRDGKILVSDAGSSRVILLRSNFRFKEEIIPGDGTNCPQVPTRILFDEHIGHLYVADNIYENSRLFAFGTI